MPNALSYTTKEVPKSRYISYGRKAPEFSLSERDVAGHRRTIWKISPPTMIVKEIQVVLRKAYKVVFHFTEEIIPYLVKRGRQLPFYRVTSVQRAWVLMATWFMA